MKRLASVFLAALLGAVMLDSPAWAGVDELDELDTKKASGKKDKKGEEQVKEVVRGS